MTMERCEFRQSIEPSGVQLLSFDFTRLDIRAPIDAAEGGRKVDLSVKSEITGAMRSDDGVEMRSQKVSISLHPKDGRPFHSADVEIVGAFAVPEGGAIDKLVTDGVKELYSIAQGAVYSATSGALMLPSVSVGGEFSTAKEE